MEYGGSSFFCETSPAVEVRDGTVNHPVVVKIAHRREYGLDAIKDLVLYFASEQAAINWKNEVIQAFERRSK
jgi:hypothetical protein